MTDPRKQAFQPYVNDLASRLCLKDWTIEISDEPADDGNAAEIVLNGETKRATIRLTEYFLDESTNHQRHVLVHELIHCHFGAASEWARSCLGQVETEAFRRMFEIGVDGLADAIAPLMPLPEVSREQ